jgi:hypothetical protein
MSPKDPIERRVLVARHSCIVCKDGSKRPDNKRCRGCITVEGKPGFREEVLE